MTRRLVWLRADLRHIDNTALLAACQESADEVACVYAITPAQWAAHDVAPVRVDFERRQLHALRHDLDALGIPLLMIHVPDYAGLPSALVDLARKHDVSDIHANRQYEVNEQARDVNVQQRLRAAGVTFHLHEDQCLVPPGTVLKADGTFYSVFTPFKRVWLQRLEVAGAPPRPAPNRRRSAFTQSDAVPDHFPSYPAAVHTSAADTSALGTATAVIANAKKIDVTEWWPAGENAALDRLRQFAATCIRNYDTQRDFPGHDGTSRLSPYLAAGILSPRQCLNAALRARSSHPPGSNGVDTWISELCWRDFYKHVLVGWPRVSRHRPFRLETDPVRWRHDKEEFGRWCEGRTGFPIVDAAMRQLNATGWMHNRLRMIVAMFLTKDLLIDWRWGEKYFMQHLIDGDLAANNGGWQWSASTGNDAAPYFRIFNPVTQGRKFDPDGTFIREWVPELRHFDGDVHDPHSQGQATLFTDYPPPMVDHSAARERTLTEFQRVRAL
ncbi:MAG TPA: FAD-binding domain-containing protein [Moraxellaceae bacterium]|nr:FAD-binding domain-containing protein [Moraxellaceae bacterium]